MPDIKEIKGHIKRVQDTRKVTKAMYLISSVKYGKAKTMYMNFVPYFNSLEEEIRFISACTDKKSSPYLESFSDRAACLVVTADKGLAGDYSKNICKKALEFYRENPDALFYVIGAKGKSFFERTCIPVQQYLEIDYSGLTEEKSEEICDIFCDLFLKNKIGKAFAIFNATSDGFRRNAETKQFLPLTFPGAASGGDFEFLPDRKAVIDNLIPQYLRGVIHSVLVQSFFSEQGARMTAMNSAENNANNMLEELNIQYNHIRQNAITQEITEISGERK